MAMMMVLIPSCRVHAFDADCCFILVTEHFQCVGRQARQADRLGPFSEYRTGAQKVQTTTRSQGCRQALTGGQDCKACATHPGQDDVSGALGSGSGSGHSNTDIGLLQSRGIIHTITCAREKRRGTDQDDAGASMLGHGAQRHARTGKHTLVSVHASQGWQASASKPALGSAP